ncbi:MAG: phosphoglycerate mutase family protein [bacterium]|nr:phosphoglycerate mutase family protein [bacterium]
MEQLILVRHGDFSTKDDSLTYLGLVQINSLSGNLKRYFTNIPGSKVAVFSSPAGRCCETAEIIGATFGVKFEKRAVLCPPGISNPDLERTMELVCSQQDVADVLILVTHAAHVQFFSVHFMRERLGVSEMDVTTVALAATQVESGEARIVNCKRKTLVRVLPD